MEDWAELQRTLEKWAASGHAEVREDGEWLAELAALHCEIRIDGKSSLLHLWSDDRNLTRRVLGVKERSENCLTLEVQRFGRSKPGRLEFVRTDAPRAASRVTREQFRARLRRILAEQFPDATIDALTSSADLKRSFSGVYVRGRMHEGARAWAVMAVSASESSAAVEGILAFGILWLDAVRNQPDKRAVEGLRLFVPKGAARHLRARLLGLSSSARTEIFELDESAGEMRKLDVADAGNLESWLMPRSEVESAVAAAKGAAARVRQIIPDASEAIELRAAMEPGEAQLCFRGLEFARYARGEIFFGLGEARERLAPSNATTFERLLRSLDLHRNSLAQETNHAMYRAAPERWLETLVLADPSRIEATLDPAHLYSQVPALEAGDRGVLDLLGITRRGRLVVIELKASEDIQLPLQAVDYWLRVRRHQGQGDFERFGYFAGKQLDPAPPLVWLVAPGLRFHPSADILLKYLAPEIRVTRIGINENWRRGVKVVLRQ
ncbi:MAG TPA: hypothetical protein VIC00_06910 [Candidatus Acidoferrales bacterium]